MGNLLQRLRGPRLAGISLFDLGGTLAVAYFVGVKYFPNINVLYIMGGAIGLGVVVHKALGINTPLNYDLGLSPAPGTTKLHKLGL